ncbi:protein-tyrosine-phosphatase MKP1-like isoform X2 [Asparagus officinalis]|uniref:protein-tyrosine-phosphatase MKP1-like isoform X2 n=1 Tax=Asparagus officinalis TaxID=4686 RepID=UPI00098E0915|nr:protein-tyrosine-phosphatase MKP1-like isoform X2 [Asparagus officinalis]
MKKKLSPPLADPSTAPSPGPSAPTLALIHQTLENQLAALFPLSSRFTARSPARHGITHVLNCVGTPRCPDYFRGDLVYKTLYLHDSPAEDITSVLYDAFDYLEEVRSLDGARAFVHCSKGASRSAALVIAYLIWSSSLSFQDALAHVRSARSVADPNLGFASQLLQCQNRFHALPPSPGSVVRVYRMAPHSPYDPLHLVPKVVDRPWLPRFDSRGAFLVVHVSHGIFIWLGSFCERVMAVRANEAARQIVRYERVKVSIFTVSEGSESSEFWDVLNGEDFCDTSVTIDVGNRKVELYDLDFEIFRRAITGGVVPPAPMAGSETRLPARESAWSRVRKKFLRRCGDITEIGNKDDEEEEEQKENTEFRSPSSLSSITSGSDFTPTLVSKLPHLHSRKVKNNEEATGSLQSLAVRRGSNPPCLVLLPPVEGGKCRLSPRDIVRDWCLSSPFVSDLEEHHVH